eukprot:CAMPEP_0170369902 /NCGR_PEP_ID=MMETSP0117_2-20130122/8229_1 /TAXON_ID=400756 /ORGANISM="Durinskia baltica, Strain CSIRO CS-38" /LENGTH=59 /DNA_ID=CAMNT_0010624649 /DNA_START=276 /DNA_END=455 /DNA_ORIENTATION=+
MYVYTLNSNATVNICSDKVNGGSQIDLTASINYEAAPGSEDCKIGLNLFIGTPIDNLCN